MRRRVRPGPQGPKLEASHRRRERRRGRPGGWAPGGRGARLPGLRAAACDAGLAEPRPLPASGAGPLALGEARAALASFGSAGRRGAARYPARRNVQLRSADPPSLPSFDHRVTSSLSALWAANTDPFSLVFPAPCFPVYKNYNLLNLTRASSRDPVPRLGSPWIGKGFNLGREQRENPLPLCSKAFSSFAGLGAWQDPTFPGKYEWFESRKCICWNRLMSQADSPGKKCLRLVIGVFSHGIYRHLMPESFVFSPKIPPYCVSTFLGLKFA